MAESGSSVCSKGQQIRMRVGDLLTNGVVDFAFLDEDCRLGRFDLEGLSQVVNVFPQRVLHVLLSFPAHLQHGS